MKNFCSVKGLVRGLATDWKKYLQTTYRIKNSQKRTIKLGSKSTIQLENEQKTETATSRKKAYICKGTHENIFNIISQEGDASYNNNEACVRMAKTKSDDTKC